MKIYIIGESDNQYFHEIYACKTETIARAEIDKIKSCAIDTIRQIVYAIKFPDSNDIPLAEQHGELLKKIALLENLTFEQCKSPHYRRGMWPSWYMLELKE